MNELYLISREILECLHSVEFNQLCVIGKRRQSFSVGLPVMTRGCKDFNVKYVNCDNGIHLELIGNKFISEWEFKELFFRKFSILKSFDLDYAAEKIWSIVKKHRAAYDDFQDIITDLADSEFIAISGEDGRCALRDLQEDEPVAVKDIEICKTYAMSNGVLLELLMGDFKFDNGVLVREGYNLYNVAEKDSCKHKVLLEQGSTFDSYMGGWKVPTSIIEKTMQVSRSVMDDIELKEYISERIAGWL